MLRAVLLATFFAPLVLAQTCYWTSTPPSPPPFIFEVPPSPPPDPTLWGGCDWIRSNSNGFNEYIVGNFVTPSECIDLATAEGCGIANIGADTDAEGSTCWCQSGTAEVEPYSFYMSCNLAGNGAGPSPPPSLPPPSPDSPADGRRLLAAANDFAARLLPSLVDLTESGGGNLDAARALARAKISPAEVLKKHRRRRGLQDFDEYCPADKQVVAYWGDDNSGCGAFQKNSACQRTWDLGWWGEISECCAASEDDCCEDDVAAIVGVTVGLIVLICAIVGGIVACICCGACKCCPCNVHNKKEASARGPSARTTGAGAEAQPVTATAVVAQPVAAVAVAAPMDA